MSTRRAFLAAIAAVAAPKVALTETPPPNCLSSSSLAEGWRGVANVINSASFNQGKEPPEITIKLVKRMVETGFSGFDGLGVLEVKGGSFDLKILSDDKLGATIDMPQIVAPDNRGKDVRVGKDFLIGRKTSLDFYLDEDTSPARLNEIARFRSIEIAEFSPQYRARLLNAKTLKLVLNVEGLGTIFGVIGMTGVSASQAQAMALTEDYRATLIEAGKCVRGGGCMMTTAAVDYLGRADDCFELTQMRQLRAVYADETDVIDAYIAASTQILSLPGTPWRNLRLITFYLAVVWPTALLVRARLYRAARVTYLAGFRALMGKIDSGARSSSN